ncbi:Signal peptide peptidase-like 2B [Tupaia chinensis]|uniref:Signal peptide peptidase-like 2B n=1 Tax=Tupaia chinensis TaxID=246437 RepID=L8Y2K0_TUPCH|nr:Signal peptide peptidase-like 2B [Tupaia chinensis]
MDAVPPGGNKTQYEEIGIPVALLSHKDMLDIFRGAVPAVTPRCLPRRYMKHKRDDGPEKQEDEAVDVTPVMICVFVVMCCSMLVLLYYFYDHLVYVIIGIFCLASSTGLYSCLAPLVRRLPLCACRVPDNSLPYFHKRPQVRMLLLALCCVALSVLWGVFRNEDQWAWVLQDALGIAFCLYMLKTIRLPTFKLPMVLKVPRLNSSPLALCDRPFSLLGFGDILVPVAVTATQPDRDSTLRRSPPTPTPVPGAVRWPRLTLVLVLPGLLVAYCHRFDIQVQSSRVYFVACTIAYGIGLLVTFVALALMRRGQPALLYLVPCTLVTSCAVALWRRELGAFWTGSGFAKDLPQPPWATPAGDPQPPQPPPKEAGTPPAQRGASEELARPPSPAEQPGEPSVPKGARPGASAPEPGSPAASTPEPEPAGRDQASPDASA